LADSTRLCAGRIWGSRAAWAAGIVFAIFWPGIHYSGELLAASLTVALDLWLVWLLLREDDAVPGWKTTGGIGLVWGLSAVARPTILALIPIIVWYLARHRGLGRAPAPWLALAAGLLLPILPVTVHNVVRGGDTVIIASQAGVNFYVGNNPSSDGQTAFVPGLTAGWRGDGPGSLDLACRETGRELSPAGADRHFMRKGLEYWLHDTGDAVALAFRKAGLLLAAGERSNNKNLDFWRDRSRVLRSLAWAGWALLLPLAALGFCRRDISSGRRFLLLGSVAIYSVAVVAFFVNARYRLPVAALLIVPAGGGIDVLLTSVRNRSLPRPAWGLALAAIVLAGSLAADRIGSHNPGDEDFFSSWKLLGDGYLAAGDVGRAKQAYREAVAADLADPRSHRIAAEDDLYPRFGALLNQEEGLAPVRDLYSRWLRIRPNRAAPRVALGDLLLQAGEAASALEYFTGALATSPDDPGAAMGRAWALYQLGDDQEALVIFRRLEDTPGDIRASFGAGLCLIRLEKWGEAESTFLRIMKVQPDYWQALGNLAGLYERTGRIAEARNAYRRLLRINPGDVRARQWLENHRG